jgi:hypothetical protein
MIFIPIFIQKPLIGTYTVSEEHQKEIQARRDKVLHAVHPHGSALRDIAYSAGEDIRTTQAILTVLQKQNKVITECAPYGKIWRRLI